MQDYAGVFRVVLLLFVAFALYFLPYIVAQSRRHKNRAAIAAVTLFFGWTVIGWVGSLVWACTDNTEPQRVSVGREVDLRSV